MRVSGGMGNCNGSQLPGALSFWYPTHWRILLLRTAPPLEVIKNYWSISKVHTDDLWAQVRWRCGWEDEICTWCKWAKWEVMVCGRTATIAKSQLPVLTEWKGKQASLIDLVIDWLIVCEHTLVSQWVWRAQRPIRGSQFSPSTQISGIELRSPGLSTGILNCWAIYFYHQTLSHLWHRIWSGWHFFRWTTHEGTSHLVFLPYLQGTGSGRQGHQKKAWWLSEAVHP